MLFKVLALPMASTLGDLSLTQLLAGSYCSSGGVQPAVLDTDGTLSPKTSDLEHYAAPTAARRRLLTCNPLSRCVRPGTAGRRSTPLPPRRLSPDLQGPRPRPPNN